MKRHWGLAGIQRNVPLAPYTTIKIGGPADLFYEACTTGELECALRTARSTEVPHFLLGCGANIVVGDRGFRGLVIRNCARGIVVNAPRHQIRADSGAIMYPDVIEQAVAHGLSGLEHYVGIPSTVGGALWQNLHFLSPPPARERTMFIEEVLQSAELLIADKERTTVDVNYFDFGYDYSTLHVRDDVVLSATFQLTPGNPAHMRAIMQGQLGLAQAPPSSVGNRAQRGFHIQESPRHRSRTG